MEIRVGADAGKAIKRSVNVQATNFQSFDIGSAALNRAVKIEQEAQAGHFLIGQALYELLHVGWLERCKTVSFDATKIGVTNYQVYRIR